MLSRNFPPLCLAAALFSASPPASAATQSSTSAKQRADIERLSRAIQSSSQGVDALNAATISAVIRNPTGRAAVLFEVLQQLDKYVAPLELLARRIAEKDSNEEKRRQASSSTQQWSSLVRNISQPEAQLRRLEKAIDELKVGVVNTDAPEYRFSFEEYQRTPHTVQGKLQKLSSQLAAHIEVLETQRKTLAGIEEQAERTIRALIKLEQALLDLALIPGIFSNQFAIKSFDVGDLSTIVGRVKSSAVSKQKDVGRAINIERERLLTVQAQEKILFHR